MKRSMDKKEEKIVLESVAEKAASIITELQPVSYDDPEKNNRLKAIRSDAEFILSYVKELLK